jgi:hypothetical protein
MWDILQEMRLNDHSQRHNNARTNARTAGRDTDRLERYVKKMALVNQALFEILQEKVGITDEELRHKISEVDLRDGVADGHLEAAPLTCPKCQTKVTAGALSCPTCGAKVAPKYPFED